MSESKGELLPAATPPATSPENGGANIEASDGKLRANSDQQHLGQRKSQGGGKTGLQKKRDTHFVCFPLVTGNSVPQLAASLEHFRRASTLTPEIARWRRVQQRHETPEKDAGGGAGDRDEGAGLTSEEFKDEDLKILPPTAHRPPGTLHLTIGTMDLSEKSEMDRAVRVLKGLELRRMMVEVEREVGYTGGAGKRKLSSCEQRQEQAEKEEQNDEPDARKIDDYGAGGKATEFGQDTVYSLNRSISPPPPPARPKPPTPSPSAPLVISLEGLSAFQSPRKARVFYAPPHDPSNRLLLLANKIRNVFRAEGFVTEKRELTLHATVANMSYASRGKKGGRGGRSVRGMEFVDGRALVGAFGGKMDGYRDGEAEEQEGGYVWAKEIVVDRVRICKMGAERSDNVMLGMVYPAIKTEGEEVAEVALG